MKKNDTQGAKEVTWQKTTTPGLYRHGPTGKFYSRYSLNGSRTFKSLDTSVLTVAKLTHAQRMLEIEKQRQSPETAKDDAKTLGDLAALLEADVAAGKNAMGTKLNFVQRMKRLREFWPGTFEKAIPRNVVRATLLELRTKLVKAGYKGDVVNQTLSALSGVLAMARERHLVVSDPFAEKPSIWLPAGRRVPKLPTRADMDRIFAEMLVIPEAENQPPELIPLLIEKARKASEHARFIAYTGARVKEANACVYEGINGNRIHIPGTKSKSSDRMIPMTAALRALLAERGIGKGPILQVVQSREALQRACVRLGLPLLHHHDLRHYFATMCIESGVDIPTVSRWLGHSDGGALVMKTYGHLRDEHSVREIAKVKF